MTCVNEKQKMESEFGHICFYIRHPSIRGQCNYGALEGWGRGQEAAWDSKDSVLQTKLVQEVTEPPVQEGGRV